MKPNEINASVKFKARLDYNPKRNQFNNIPDDLKEFLHKKEGIMQPIVEILNPDQDYEIKISIKSI